VKKKEQPINLYQALIILACIFIWIGIGSSCQSCQEQGGTFVRTAVWFACVDKE
jgi:hypothetical protein